jgi:hypothetical protein
MEMDNSTELPADDEVLCKSVLPVEPNPDTGNQSPMKMVKTTNLPTVLEFSQDQSKSGTGNSEKNDQEK